MRRSGILAPLHFDFAPPRHSDIVLPVCALKNFLSEFGFSKPQKSDIAFSGIVPERRCWARASWRYQGRIATSLIKPQSCPTLIKRLKLADLSGRQATLLRNGEN